MTETQLTWQSPGPRKRIVASKAFYQHDSPAPHIDAVESFIDYRVPVDKFTAIAECGRSPGIPLPGTKHPRRYHPRNGW